MRKTNKKLTLTSNTVRSLQTVSLDAAGGFGATGLPCVKTVVRCYTGLSLCQTMCP